MKDFVDDFSADPSGRAPNDQQFRDAIAAFKAASHFDAGTLYMPSGRYRFDRDLVIDIPLRLVGDSPERTQLLFPNSNGVAVVREHLSTDPDHPDSGQGSTIECLRIAGRMPRGRIGGIDQPGVPQRWRPNTDYVVGDRVTMYRDDGNGIQMFKYFYWECVAPGRSGPQPPSISKSGVFGADRAMIIDLTTEWKPNTNYIVGSTIRPPGRFDLVFEATSPGTSGSNPPAWAAVTTLPDDGVVWRGDRGHTDANLYFCKEDSPNGPTWAVRVHAGIRLDAQALVRQCYIENFLNAGIYIAAGEGYHPARNLIGWRVDKVGVSRCGTGIAVQGTMAHFGCATGFAPDHIGIDPDTNRPLDWVATGPNADRGGDGGIGILDLSYYGNQWMSCICENSTDRAMVLEGARQMGTVIGFWDEGVLPHKLHDDVDASSGAVLSDANIVINSYFGTGIDPRSKAAVVAHRNFREVRERAVPRRKNLAELPYTATRIIEASLISRDTPAAFLWSGNWADGPNGDNSYGWRSRTVGPGRAFDPQDASTLRVDSDWCLSYRSTGQANLFSIVDLFGALGFGWRDNSGHFRGSAGWEYFFGVDFNSKTSNVPRRGYREVGDRFEPNMGRYAPVRGGYLGKIVTKAGFVGEDWVPDTFYSAFDPNTGFPPHTVLIKGYVFVCTRSGRSSASLSPAVLAQVDRATGNRADTLSPVFSRGIVVSPWKAGSFPQLGTLIRVDVQGTPRLFMCMRTTGWGETGAAPPAWILTPAPTPQNPAQPKGVTREEVIRDGAVIGTVEWLDLGEDPDRGCIVEEPSGLQWTCAGRQPEFADYGPVYEKATLVTTTSDWNKLDAYPFDVTRRGTCLVEVTVKARSKGNKNRSAVMTLRGAWGSNDGDLYPLGPDPVRTEVWSSAPELESRLRWDANMHPQSIVLEVRDALGQAVVWESLRRPHSDRDHETF